MHNPDVLSQEQLAELRAVRCEGRNRVSAAMKLAGETQVQLAAATGFTQSYISKICTGAYDDLPGETMRVLALHFDCGLDDLFPLKQAVA